MIKILNRLVPPDNWKFPVIIMLGIFSGLGLYTVYISKAPSYLSDNPKTCVNCHIMAPQYATWSHSSHRENTHCNDCHVPHNNVINKYYFKAKDGMRHATIFTLRAEPQVIQIKEEGREAVHSNCIRCHDPLLTDAKMHHYDQDFNSQRKERLCQDCHRETPHGRVNSLASAPWARTPLPESPVPGWLKTMMKND
ncbi:MAG: cytochrome c nitrite reductase small subunit [Bacteroidales bacterium]|nr:cytochrome c nitrite reductase small subunit [Bacteroidales bacterium]